MVFVKSVLRVQSVLHCTCDDWMFILVLAEYGSNEKPFVKAIVVRWIVRQSVLRYTLHFLSIVFYNLMNPFSCVIDQSL